MSVVFPYEDRGKHLLGNIYRPIAFVLLKSPFSNSSLNMKMVVDSGADFTILPRYAATWLDISLEKQCVVNTTYGVVGAQTIYCLKPKMKVKIGSDELEIPLAFFDNNNVPPLLGRLGCLEELKLQFEGRKVTFSR